MLSWDRYAGGLMLSWDRYVGWSNVIMGQVCGVV